MDEGEREYADNSGSVALTVPELTEAGSRHAGAAAASHLRLVLITPVRNEAAFIEQTIASVTGQSVQPLKWVIVSDGSTDGTNDIVATYTDRYPWIDAVFLPERAERHFAGKVQAFNAGYARAQD